jgi:hypothetical protein
MEKLQSIKKICFACNLILCKTEAKGDCRWDFVLVRQKISLHKFYSGRAGEREKIPLNINFPPSNVIDLLGHIY